MLVYHRVLPSPPHGDEWALPLETFRRQLEGLDRHGFRDVGLSELEDRVPAPRGRRVMIALDDGYGSAYELALPALRAA